MYASMINETKFSNHMYTTFSLLNKSLIKYFFTEVEIIEKLEIAIK